MSKEKNYFYRVLIMDNGSTDSTWKLILDAAKLDSRIIGYRMSRNFSLDAAFTNGLDRATADCAIIMTSDLQDNPEIIPLLLRKFEEGFDQVLVKIVSRDTVPFVRRKLTGIFYRIANRITTSKLPESVSDYRLLSKRAYSAIRQLRESHRFIRGLGAWVGFKTTEVQATREARFAGESKWMSNSIFAVITDAMASILAHSSNPLTWISWTGLVLGVGAIFFIAFLAVFWILFGVPFAGFGTLVGIAFVGFAIFMFCIGILAQYIGLIYEEVKRRPLYIVAESTIKHDD